MYSCVQFTRNISFHGCSASSHQASDRTASRARHTPTPHQPGDAQATKNPVGQSYAKALVDLANEKGKLEPIHADMDAIGQLMMSNKALSELVTNPVVDKDKKRAVLLKIGKEAGEGCSASCPLRSVRTQAV